MLFCEIKNSISSSSSSFVMTYLLMNFFVRLIASIVGCSLLNSISVSSIGGGGVVEFLLMVEW